MLQALNSGWVVIAEFPPYSAFLEADPSASSAVVARGALVNALEACSGRPPVGIVLGEGAVEIVGTSERCALEAAFSGQPMTIVVNPAFALFAITMSVGPEVVIEGTDEEPGRRCPVGCQRDKLPARSVQMQSARTRRQGWANYPRLP